MYFSYIYAVNKLKNSTMTTDSRKDFVKYRTLKTVLLVMQWTLALSFLAIMYYGRMTWPGKIYLLGLALFGSFTFFKLRVLQNIELVERLEGVTLKHEAGSKTLARIRIAKNKQAKEKQRVFVQNTRRRSFKRSRNA